eukprot:948989-Amphidinium_carterae.2
MMIDYVKDVCALDNVFRLYIAIDALLCLPPERKQRCSIEGFKGTYHRAEEKWSLVEDNPCHLERIDPGAGKWQLGVAHMVSDWFAASGRALLIGNAIVLGLTIGINWGVLEPTRNFIWVDTAVNFYLRPTQTKHRSLASCSSWRAVCEADARAEHFSSFTSVSGAIPHRKRCSVCFKFEVTFVLAVECCMAFQSSFSAGNPHLQNPKHEHGLGPDPPHLTHHRAFSFCVDKADRSSSTGGVLVVLRR